MPSQSFSDFSADAVNYIAKKTLLRIKRDVIVYGMGKKEKLPNRFSKTFQFTRYEKLNLPYSTLTEGVTPSASSITLSTVQAVMDQWGSFVDISDVVEVTIAHPVIQEAIQLLGEQASETVDRECIKVLMANTSVYFAGSSVTARSGLAATDYMTTTLIKKAVAALRRGGARPYTGRLLIGLIDPSVEQDATEDSTFQTAASYSNILALQNGEVGIWVGVRWMVSNLIPSITRLADVTTAATTGGSLANSTTYYIKVSRVDNATGFETGVTQVQSQATGMSDTRINVTCPSATGYTYNVYAGTSTGSQRLVSSQNAPAAVVAVNSIPSTGDLAPAHPATGVTVHLSWVLGKEAFAVPELMSLETFITPKVASDSDPLAQRRKASWKVMFKAVICNEAFLARLESSSRYAA